MILCMPYKIEKAANTTVLRLNIFVKNHNQSSGMTLRWW
nr:MAG TPA: hypothetical protein [Caudoviricetes sp.]